jgi:hypothetical protein
MPTSLGARLPAALRAAVAALRAAWKGLAMAAAEARRPGFSGVGNPSAAIV